LHAQASLLAPLQDSVARGTAETRQKALDYATAAFIAGRYSDDDI